MGRSSPDTDLRLVVTGVATGAVAIGATSALGLWLTLPEPAVAAPIVLTGAALTALVAAFLLQARARAARSDALAWVALGHGLAALTMVAGVPGLAAAAQGGTAPAPAVTALAILGHVVVPVVALIGVLWAGAMARALVAAAVVATVAVLGSDGTGLPSLVSADGHYVAGLRVALAVTALVGVVATSVWAWRVSRRGVPAGWWVVVSLAVGVAGVAAHAVADAPFDNAWWIASLLRLGQTAILCAGLLQGVVGLLAQLGEVSNRLADAYARVDDLARRDPLTGLLIPRAFEQLAASELARDDGEHRSLVYLDLDGFRACNDRLGRAEGDRLLVSFADALRRNVRPDDLVARLGGDEFAVLLRHSDSATAARVIDRLGERLRGVVCFSAGIATTNQPVAVATLVHEAAEQSEAARRTGTSRRATFVVVPPAPAAPEVAYA
jgi:diguanylate cyclase (GGDEF)-like protein